MSDKQYWEIRAVLVMISARIDYLESKIPGDEPGFLLALRNSLNSTRPEILSYMHTMWPDVMDKAIKMNEEQDAKQGEVIK